MERVRRVSRSIAWVAAVGLAMAVSACATAATGSPSVSDVATATATIAPTPSPRPVAAFTCASGSLPVRPASTRTSCAVNTQLGMPVLRATYAGSGGSQPAADENALMTAGWKLDLRGDSDHEVPRQGYSEYVYQSAWLVFQWIERSDGTLDLTVQSSVPAGNAPITCGQTPAASSAQINGIMLAEGSFLLSADNWSLLSMAIVPACASDVERFYETVLPASGWHMDIPFVNTSADPSVAQAKHAIFLLGNTRATITTSGYPGTPTLIIVQTTSS